MFTVKGVFTEWSNERFDTVNEAIEYGDDNYSIYIVGEVCNDGEIVSITDIDLNYGNAIECTTVDHRDFGRIRTYRVSQSKDMTSYTKPKVTRDGEIVAYKYDNDNKKWLEDVHHLGIYTGDKTILL